MNEDDFEGTLVLEKLAEIGRVDEFFQAIDSDDFSKAKSLMQQAKIDSETISTVLKEMGIKSGAGSKKFPNVVRPLNPKYLVIVYPNSRNGKSEKREPSALSLKLPQLGPPLKSWSLSEHTRTEISSYLSQ